jgi:hypothetical protein
MHFEDGNLFDGADWINFHATIITAGTSELPPGGEVARAMYNEYTDYRSRIEKRLSAIDKNLWQAGGGEDSLKGLMEDIARMHGAPGGKKKKK